VCPTGPAYIVPANPATASLAGPNAKIVCNTALGGNNACVLTSSTNINIPVGTIVGLTVSGTPSSCNGANDATKSIAYLNADAFTVTASTATTVSLSPNVLTAYIR